MDTVTSHIISIDRFQPFDPVKFLGEYWSIGSIEEQDERSLALTHVNLNDILLMHMLKPSEHCIGGEEKMRRMKKAGYIRLDANVFQTLWENQNLIPEKWKEKINGNTRGIHFDGTVLRGPISSHSVLYLYWGDDRWYWSCFWLDSILGWGVYDYSAVLASPVRGNTSNGASI